MRASGKDNFSSHSLMIQKHERVARESIHHIVAFSDTVEKEILKLKEAERHGQMVDGEMMEKLLRVKEKQQSAMEGMRYLDATSARHRLIEYGDAVQDLMSHIHHRKH
jgi:hypothetical protein